MNDMHNTRQRNDRDIKFCKIKAGQKSLTYTRFETFKKLSTELKETEGLFAFKRKLAE